MPDYDEWKNALSLFVYLKSKNSSLSVMGREEFFLYYTIFVVQSSRFQTASATSR